MDSVRRQFYYTEGSAANLGVSVVRIEIKSPRSREALQAPGTIAPRICSAKSG
jgi:hypothetical protein